MLGFAAEELIGREVHTTMHHTRAVGTRRTLQGDPIYAALSQGRRCRVEEDIFWRRDGKPVSVEYSAAQIIVNGGYQGAVVAFAPYTDKRALSRLNDDVARFTSDGFRPVLDALAANLQRLRPTCKGAQQDTAQSFTHHLADLRAKVGKLE